MQCRLPIPRLFGRRRRRPETCHWLGGAAQLSAQIQTPEAKAPGGGHLETTYRGGVVTPPMPKPKFTLMNTSGPRLIFGQRLRVTSPFSFLDIRIVPTSVRCTWPLPPLPFGRCLLMLQTG